MCCYLLYQQVVFMSSDPLDVVVVIPMFSIRVVIWRRWIYLQNIGPPFFKGRKPPIVKENFSGPVLNVEGHRTTRLARRSSAATTSLAMATICAGVQLFRLRLFVVRFINSYYISGPGVSSTFAPNPLRSQAGISKLCDPFALAPDAKRPALSSGPRLTSSSCTSYYHPGSTSRG